LPAHAQRAATSAAKPVAPIMPEPIARVTVRPSEEAAKTAEALKVFQAQVVGLTQSTLVLLDGGRGTSGAAMHGSSVALNEVSVPEPGGQAQKSEAYVPQVSSEIISEAAYSSTTAPAKKAGRDAVAKKLKRAIEDALSQRDPSKAKQQPGEGSLSWAAQPQSASQGGTPKATGSLKVKVQTSH
jgi:hypothetical protein